MKRGKKLLAKVVGLALIVQSFASSGVAFAATTDEISISDTFTDSTFRSYVSMNFDSNTDGYLSAEEISNVKTIDVSQLTPAIRSLSGVELFTGLTSLDCSGQAIKAVDVSGMPLLETLNVESNQISNLDLTNNKELTSLNVSGNLMTTLGLSQNSKLKYLNASGISIKSIDVSDMSELLSLNVSNTAITNLDVSANSKLMFLFCEGVKTLNYLDVSNHDDLLTLTCSDSSLTTLDASGNSSLYSINCSGSALSSINVNGDTSLSLLYCSTNKLESIDLSTNTNLSLLDISNNKLGKNGINLEANKSITELDVSGNSLESIDLSNNASLEILRCNNNSLTSIDVSTNKALQEFYVDDNQLTSLDLFHNGSLNTISCSNNSLTALDLSMNSGLIDEEGNLTGSVTCSGNFVEINLDETNYNYDLSQLPNFVKGTGEEIDISNRKAMVALDSTNGKTTGAIIDAYNLLPEINATEVSYNYYYGIGANYVTFKLKINNPLKVKVVVKDSSNSAAVGDNLEMQKGSEVTLAAIHSVTENELANITWSSGDDKIATIDEYTGRLSCIGTGVTPIYITFNGRTIGDVNLSCVQPVSAINLDKTEIDLDYGNMVDASKKTATLVPTVLPTDAGHKEVKWTSSNTKVATVSQTGVVKATGSGTAIITCTSEYGPDNAPVTATCTVNVTQHVDSVGLNKSTAKLFAGDTLVLSGVAYPATAANQDVEWSSDNEAVATVDNEGNVVAVSTGIAHITCKSVDSPEAKAVCTVTVLENVSDVSLNYNEYELILGSTTEDKSIILESYIEGGDPDVEYTNTWSSSNTSIATVDRYGKVTARAPGTATITCEITSTRKATCVITVVQRATSITIVKDRTSINLGESMTVSATVNPANTTNKNVLWESSDNNVATINQNGLITTVGKGITVIKCSATDGSEKSASFTLTVKKLVTSVDIDATAIDLYVGKSMTIASTVLPEDANTRTLLWSSSDTSVATVSSSGSVRGVGEGTATITCKTTDGSNIVKSCEVTVHQQISRITLDKTSETIYVGNKLTITPTIMPENAENSALVWSSSNDTVAKVSSTGEVTALAKGTVTITCSAADGLGAKATCRITVIELVKTISLSNSSLTMFKGKTAKLTASVLPATASNKSVTWTSSNINVATVSSGTITAVANGTATITCTANDGSGVKAVCKVMVVNPVTSIKLNYSSKTINVGKTATLVATVGPANAGNKTVSWTSSNPKVATVTSTGVVKAVGRGSATITCTAKDGSGISASCVITAVQKVTKITLNKRKVTIKKGNTYTLKATVKPTNANNKAVTWKTSNKKVATVSSNGVVTAKKKGKVTITCRAKDGSKKYAKCTITVK